MTSPESTEEFRSYLEKLYRHEQFHCARAVKSMREIYLAFTDGQRGNCSKANERVIELEGDWRKVMLYSMFIHRMGKSNWESLLLVRSVT
ncbi:DUF922 domain-containing protein [Vibrio nereis]|uniref:DUF922 domain-containing protein n=1 Tax=Vibrio nereis TaxID=693 RepID=UPI002493F7A1|nr:DUF922 domain-containing protein [Vibrio nereis]